MGKQTILLAYLFCISGVATFGQTATQFKEQYGQPIEAYSVSEHIWMTPEFAADGQICSVRLYPKRISPADNFLTDKLYPGELTEVLEKLVPLETRGKRTEFFGLTLMLGQMASTSFNYEQVSIGFLASLTFNRTSGSGTSTLVKSTQAGQAEVQALVIPSNAEIATISWTGRVCLKP